MRLISFRRKDDCSRILEILWFRVGFVERRLIAGFINVRLLFAGMG